MTAIDAGLDGVDLGPGPFTIAGVTSLDPAGLADSALVEAVGLIDEQIAWLTSLRAGHLAVLAERHASDADDGRQWEREQLAARCGISGWESARRLRAAVDLQERLPMTAAALRSGAISWRHAETLSSQTGELPESEAQRIERRVLADTRAVTARQYETRARTLASAWDEHPEQTPDPVLRVGSAVCGSVPFEAWLPEPDAALVMTALDALATPTDPDDHRSVSWRRADALVELCRASLDGGLPAAANGVRPHLTLLADAADWRSGCTVTLAGIAGLPAVEVHAETARELTCDAGVSVGEHAGGVLGRFDDERRFAGPALRRRLEARDQGCRFLGCCRAARRCHAHHIRHWADGGPTTETNLLLLCARHHHAVHDGSWTLAFDGRTAAWTDPDGRRHEHRAPLARPPDWTGDWPADSGRPADPG